MSLNEVQTLTAALANVTVALAIFAGGIGTLFTFRSLLEIPRKTAELRETEARIRKSELDALLAEAELRKSDAEIHQLEIKNKTQAVVEIEIGALQAQLPLDEGRYIDAKIQIKNSGNQNTRILLKNEHPFSVRKVTFDQTGQPHFSEPRHFDVTRAAIPEETAIGILVRTGSTEIIPFFIAVDSQASTTWHSQFLWPRLTPLSLRRPEPKTEHSGLAGHSSEFGRPPPSDGLGKRNEYRQSKRSCVGCYGCDPRKVSFLSPEARAPTQANRH